MVNITYGVLVAPQGTSNASSNIALNGTDLIVTYDEGKIASYSPGDIAWILTCTTLVWLMIPGLGYLYSGLARRKNALHLLLLTLAALAVVSFQWFFWGYSLTFSQTGGVFMGDLRNFGFMGVLEAPVPGANNKLPEIVYAMYEGMFAALVPAIALGAACERARVWPFLVLTFCWTTLVFDPIACWVWAPNGWAFKWGVLDYAGGGPVEIASGITGTVISYYLGPRHGYGTERLLFKPHNVSHVVLGTAFLWFGWMGFNGGSTFAANLRAGMSIATTNTAASCAGLTWMFMDWRIERKWSVVGFCTGAIAGLVAITPAAGFVGVPASVLIGVAAAALSNLSTSLKNLARCDDVMDIFAVHALAGIVGLLLTGIFTQASVANNDGYLVIDGGWLDGNWIQLPKQIAWCAVTVAWAAVVTWILMFVIDHIPYIGPFRSTELAEIIGLDEDQCGEYAYDYARVNRDLEGNCDRNLTSARDEPYLDIHERVGQNPGSPDINSEGTRRDFGDPGANDGMATGSDQEKGHGTTENDVAEATEASASPA
ncbi:ammonium transporter [Tilletiaria anomala UBC 951]|uniref:Ammonium transporter n=1 Tax=Tilletiaria anomala (strain ATCC 24038 / CBS 436.72 / UBC 951) TaxID=1037660 RepID=A0A066WH31_TILAU|nr:ammonium transporter [Tilletiaria anomala UBC 951]KDN53302.1 ammonium transporter [Tilletiaria anomala UBC 951]